MNRLLFVATWVVCTVPLYAQGQQPDMPKLKVDAKNVASIIKGDKTKTQTYCQMSDIAKQVDEAEKEKDKKKPTN